MFLARGVRLIDVDRNNAYHSPATILFHFLLQACMKRYIVLGLLLGITLSAFLVLLRRRNLAGTEFRGFFDSSTVADELFGDAFEEFPDKL